MMETLARCHRRKSVTTSYRGEGQIIVYTRSQWWTRTCTVASAEAMWFGLLRTQNHHGQCGVWRVVSPYVREKENREEEEKTKRK